MKPTLFGEMKVTDNIEPRRWQSIALRRWQKDQRGVVKVVTGGGKTIFAYLCIQAFSEATRKPSVVILVPSIALMDQWYLDLVQNMTIPEKNRCWEQLLRPGGVCVMVVGDVDLGELGQLNLAAEILREVRAETSLQLVDLVEDQIEVSGKVTRIWGSRRGNATRVDRILVLKKPGARRCRARKPTNIVSQLRAIN